MPGWRDEAKAEDLESYAQRTVNNKGRREYEGAFIEAKG